MSKYAPLEAYLRDVGRQTVRMTFDEIANVIGAELPPSTLKYRALWSNNPTNHVMTRAWLEAGYKTQGVDMVGRTVVFRRVTPDTPPPGSSGTPRAPLSGSRTPAYAKSHGGSFSDVFGALKGTVTIAPDTDLTAPLGEDWDATHQEFAP